MNFVDEWFTLSMQDHTYSGFFVVLRHVICQLLMMMME